MEIDRRLLRPFSWGVLARNRIVWVYGLLPPWLIFAGYAVAQPPVTPVDLTFGTKEVVLDFLVTDRKGRSVVDLTKDEVTVLDKGTKQQIVGFRLVDATGGGASRTPEPHLITLVFEDLDTDARRQARAAGMELLKAIPADGIYVAVMANHRQLCLLQPFTTDRGLLQSGIEMATSGKTLAWVQHSLRQKDSLVTSLGAAQEQDKRLRETMLQMMKPSEVITVAGRTTTFEMWSLVRGQRTFPGRKGIVYVWGMGLPPYLELRYLVTEANRANVSFYPISALGVETGRLSADAIVRDDGRVSAGGVTGLAHTASRNDLRSAMKELADATGGESFADTNSFRKPMRAVAQSLTSYYEITYTPEIQRYDGSFRRTEVRVARAGVHVRTRNGYYALP
jgi:VWFA-related protein